MYIISARELKIAAIFICFLSTYFCEFPKKQKTRLKDNFETSYITRGTTQIADTKNLPLFEVYQLLCTNVAFTGNIYWVFKPFGLPAQK